ncbi:hypothetical protein C8F01DRAFT_1101424 [Mycena amicta]|nr:hypothetical protein C8F01DRAFT_1101424 [Mycena amicta]
MHNLTLRKKRNGIILSLAILFLLLAILVSSLRSSRLPTSEYYLVVYYTSPVEKFWAIGRRPNNESYTKTN